eukprot:TRINITY_DN2049_c0_g1_i1.p1 TRINITY_DN2049_c0_g1~~TRINITY_DN2049_c0_g1_i1.p1  ORF type:complete len:1056 (+),score=270.43 TRINITY_DN2049_c0_g1_i1:109-3276(+)
MSSGKSIEKKKSLISFSKKSSKRELSPTDDLKKERKIRTSKSERSLSKSTPIERTADITSTNKPLSSSINESPSVIVTVADVPEEANMITSSPQRSMAINISKVNRNLDTLDEHPESENSQSKSMPASPTFHEEPLSPPLTPQPGDMEKKKPNRAKSFFRKLSKMASRKQLNNKTTDDIESSRSGSKKVIGKHSTLRGFPKELEKMEEEGEISPRGKDKSGKSKNSHVTAASDFTSENVKLIKKNKRLNRQVALLVGESIQAQVAPRINRHFHMPLSQSLASARAAGQKHFYRVAIDYLKQHGPATLGIFRIAKNRGLVNELKEQLELGYQLIFESKISVHDIASLLKMWIRELKDPLIPKSLYKEFIDIKRNLSESENFSEQAVKPIRALFDKLEIDNQDVLLDLLEMLHLIFSTCSVNLMNAKNLAIVLSPCILQQEALNSKDEMIPDVLQELALAEEILTVMIEKFPIIFDDMITVRQEHKQREEALDEELDQIRQELENMGTTTPVTRERGNTIATTREFADISLSPPNSDRKKDKTKSIFIDLEESISTLNNDKDKSSPTDSSILPKTPPPTPRVNLDLSISLSSDTVTTNSIAPSNDNSPHLSSGSMSSQLTEASENANAGATETSTNNNNTPKDEKNSLKVSVEVGKEHSRQRLREIEDEIMRLIDEIEDEQKSGKVEYMSLSSSYEEKAEIDSMPTTPRSVADDAAKKDDEAKPAEAETNGASAPTSPEKFEENNNNTGERKETKEERAARREARRQKRKDKKERKERETEAAVSTNGDAAKNSTDQSENGESKVDFVIPEVNITPAEDAPKTEDQPTERKRSRSVRIQQEDGTVVELGNNSAESELKPIGEDDEIETRIEVSNDGDTLVVNIKKRKSLVIGGSGSTKRVSLKEQRVKKLVEEFTKLQEDQETRLEELRTHRARARFDRVMEEINGMNSSHALENNTSSSPSTPRDGKSSPYVPVIQSGPRPTSAKSYVPKGPHHFVPMLSTNDFKNNKGGAKNSPRTHTSNVSDVGHVAAKPEEHVAQKVEAQTERNSELIARETE